MTTCGKHWQFIQDSACEDVCWKPQSHQGLHIWDYENKLHTAGKDSYSFSRTKHMLGKKKKPTLLYNSSGPSIGAPGCWSYRLPFTGFPDFTSRYVHTPPQTEKLLFPRLDNWQTDGQMLHKCCPLWVSDICTGITAHGFSWSCDVKASLQITEK